MLLFCGTAFAEGEKITDLFIKGNRRIETAAIMNVVKLKTGDYLFADKVDADIRSIHKLGQFQDVKAETAKSDKGVILTYTVVEKPIVREIRIEGNKEIAVDKIKEAVEIKVNAIFSPRELTKSVKKVKKLYADEGYYLAEVEANSEKRSDSEVKVVFKITEGEKVLIKAIRFEGNRVFTARQLKKVMETTEKWFLSWLTGAGTYKEDVLKNDANLIADLYYNNGYVNVKVGEPRIELLPDKSGLLVAIGITEGDQFKVGFLGFKGDLLESEGELAKKLKLKSGEVFSRATLRGDVFALTDLYADKGYAFANITPLSKLNQEQKNIDVTFDFEKGEKVYIDRIDIGGNTKTRDKVIRRELKLAEGDLYGATALKRSKQNLMNLGFFEEANLATAKGSADNKLNLNVDVKEKPTGTFSIGGGYSSLDGLIGQGSIQQANFLGLGLKLNAAASIGGKSQTYNLGLTDPYFMDTKWTLGADVYRSQRDYLDFTRRVTGGDIKAGYPLSDTMSTFWMYKFEDKKIFNESLALLDNIARGLVVQPETTATTSSITASISRNTTDYRLDPTTGMVNSLSVEFAGLGGSNRFARYIGNTTVFFPAIWGTVFSLRGELGHIQGIGKDVPIDEKFYLGGINTVRGYGGRTVSPFNANTVTTTDISGIATTSVNRVFVGGDTEAVFNAEYQFPLIKEAGLKGVLFFDAGNAYDGASKLFSSLQMSYGAGIRWFSPIGPLRLEYGIPLNPRDGIDNASGKLEFSIGSFF
ncbi:MAG: outer membrane [Geobacteraceae bacterium]|nr:MAG: outer membrane [Geobacteraceae bacterium]